MIAPRLQCPSKIMVNNFLKEMISQGGEGLMMRKCNSLYEHGRSSNLLKLKVKMKIIYIYVKSFVF